MEENPTLSSLHVNTLADFKQVWDSAYFISNPLAEIEYEYETQDHLKPVKLRINQEIETAIPIDSTTPRALFDPIWEEGWEIKGEKVRGMPELFIQKENTNPLFTNPDQTLIVQKTKLPNWHSPPNTLKALLGKDGLLRYDFIVDVHGAITTTLYAGYDRLRSLRFRSILANVAAQSWSDQPFEGAFRELNDATKFEQSLSLSDTVQMLDRRVHTQGEKVEIFGAKVPLNIITSLGGLIVVCCQLYLWGHLRELTRLLSNEREEAEVTGHIGIYRDVLMKALTVLSVSFLPPAIEVLLIRKKPSEFSGVDMLVLISAAIGLLSWQAFNQLWKMLETKATLKNEGDSETLPLSNSVEEDEAL